MINKVILIGNVGKDPEIFNFDNGGKVANFSLATSGSYKNKQGEKVDSTEWHNIVIREKLADLCEKYVNKGDKLYLEGSIKTRKYESKGETKYITEIHCYKVTFLGGKKGEQAPDVNGEGDDLPF
jgi:single-strand DNA-binding protein